MCSHKMQCELLEVANRAIAHYYRRRCPKAIDLDLLIMVLTGGSIKMFPLSKDGSVLGMTAHERLTIQVELEDGTVIRDTLRPKDIVVDSSLAGLHNTGARNFTLAHEIGHQLLRARFKAMARHLGVQRQLLAERMRFMNVLTSDVPYRQSLLLLEGK